MPGDLHVHFFGTSKLSFQQRTWLYQSGDVVEVAFAGLGAALQNPIERQPSDSTPVRIGRG